MEYLVAYDVDTTTKAGEKRLRKVAKVCEGNGQRVQNSVFECILNEVQLERLVHRLSDIIDDDLDSLRIYRLREPHDQYLQILGRSPQFDIRGPIIM